jgi:hypothetical protein
MLSNIANLNLDEPSGGKVAIAVLSESMKQHDFRLMKLENKFDKLQETLEHRFDKFEESAEARRKEMIEFQAKLAKDIRDALELTRRNAEDIDRVDKRTETDIKSLSDKTEKEINEIKDEVKGISSMKLRILGAIGLLTFLLALFGKDLIKFLSGNMN